MTKKILVPSDYTQAFDEIKRRVRAAQYEALKAVNLELITLYWDIGGIIVTRQQSAAWGRSVVKRLAEDLQQEFPGVSGFSAPNLWRMRNFYKTYAADQKFAPLVREIGWSHNVIIMERCRKGDTIHY
jgi:predicted nuclease of restriction endonuclease-like (RecB) superfamily